MKKFLIVLYFVFVTFSLFSQAPQMFNYSAVVRDAGGSPVLNQPVSFRFSILSGSSTGTLVYIETHSVTTDAFGTVSLQIGEGVPISGNMATTNWSGTSHYLKVEIDNTGGTSYVNMGTTQLLSVPYALYANQAGTTGGSPWTVSGNNIYNNNSGYVGIGSANPTGKLTVAQDPSMSPTEALFEIKNFYGQTVFAVYPDSVRIYIRDDGGPNLGAFAVCGRNTAKALTCDFLHLTPDSIRLFDTTGTKNVGINRNVSNYPLHVGTNTSNGNGAFLSAGGVWTNSSSRAFKDRFTVLPKKDVVDKIAAMKIQGWYYKGTSEYHIGPVAEDFYAAFGCGSKAVPGDVNRYIATSDVAGVTFIAVQELINTIRDEKQKNQMLMEENEAMKTMLVNLKTRVEALENK